MEQAKKVILKRKARENSQREQVFTDATSEKNYLMLKESVIYLVYIAVFVIMILYQTNNKSAQAAGWPVQYVLTRQEFNTSGVVNGSTLTKTFKQIDSTDEMFAFVEQNVIPFIYETSTIAEQANVAVG